MPNPKPKIENLKHFKKVGDRELGKVIGIRFPVEVEAALNQMSDRQAFIRAAVEDALIEKGLLQSSEETTSK